MMDILIGKVSIEKNTAKVTTHKVKREREMHVTLAPIRHGLVTARDPVGTSMGKSKNRITTIWR